MFEFLMKLPSGNNNGDDDDVDEVLKSKNLGKDETDAQELLKRISKYS